MWKVMIIRKSHSKSLLTKLNLEPDFGLLFADNLIGKNNFHKSTELIKDL